MSSWVASSGLRGSVHTSTNVLIPGGAAARRGAPAVPGTPTRSATARELAVWVVDYLLSVKVGSPESFLFLGGVHEHPIATDAAVLRARRAALRVHPEPVVAVWPRAVSEWLLVICGFAEGCGRWLQVK